MTALVKGSKQDVDASFLSFTKYITIFTRTNNLRRLVWLTLCPAIIYRCLGRGGSCFLKAGGKFRSGSSAWFYPKSR